MRHALIVVNPVAGQQQPVQVAARVAEALRRAGWSTATAHTESSGHATRIGRERGAGSDLVVVVGGDGTLRETMIGVREVADVPMGFVPIGKANVIARELGIPRVPERAIAALTDGRERVVDAGRVGDSIFLAMVGVGYDGWATAGVAWMRATGWGGFLYRHGASTLLYVLAGIPALFRLVPNRVEVSIDGARVEGRFPSLTISNAETYSIGWAVTPGANIDDGLFDVQANRRSAPWFVLWTLAAAILRRRVPALVARYERGRKIVVEAPRPFRWQVDGDSMRPTRRLEIEVLPGYARLLVPSHSGD